VRVPKRRKILLLVLAVVLVISAGCRQERTEPQGNQRINQVDRTAFKVGLLHEIESLDPLKIKHFGEMQVARALYETLVAVEPETGRLVPLLAEQWEVSDDGRSYLLRLRQGIKFHSGRELTAEDVKFSWQRVLAQRWPEDLATAFLSIAGAAEYASGRIPQVTGLEVVDPYTLRINLASPRRDFLKVLAHPAAAVVDMKVVELVGDHYGEPGDYQAPVVALAGTGPFAMVEWIGGMQVTVQAFDQYHGEMPRINRLEFIQYPDLEMLCADFEGEYLDLALVPSGYEQYLSSSTPALALPDSDLFYLGFNLEKEPFHLEELREAISRSLDRGALAGIYEGQPLTGLMPRSLVEGHPPRASYAGAGPVPGTGPDQWPGLVLTHAEGEPWSTLAAAIAAQLEQKGFQVQLHSLAEEDFQEAVRSGKAGFFLNHWQSWTPWAEFFLESRFAPWGLANGAGYGNPVVEDRFLFMHAQGGSDGERLENLLEIERMVQEEHIIISLGASRVYLLLQENVKDLTWVEPGLVMWEKCSRS